MIDVGVEPDGIKPGPNDRPIFALIVTCDPCGVSWDMDADPARCTNPDHEHRIDWEVPT